MPGQYKTRQWSFTTIQEGISQFWLSLQLVKKGAKLELRTYMFRGVGWQKACFGEITDII
jgi:hypothetical protein